MNGITYFEMIFLPIAVLAIGIVLGIIFSPRQKRTRSAGRVAVAGWALTSGAAMWYVGMIDYQQLTNLSWFTDFATLIKGTPYSNLVMGSVQKTALAALIVLYEFGLISGFAAVSPNVASATSALKNGRPEASELPITPAFGNGNGSNISGNTLRLSRSNNAGHADDPFVSMGDQTQEYSNSRLEKDERTILELFVFGKVTKIIPHIDPSKPEGFYFDGTPMNLDTKRMRQVLESMSRKGYTTAELSDKILLCNNCGALSLQLRNMCPECRSMKLTKHNVIEHFSCGAIDKQENFQNSNGDLLCPKCHGRLHLIGSDYRNLSQMYVCQECSAINKDLLQLMKCAECGATAPVEEQKERSLYSYTLNENAIAVLADQIKPIDTCSSHFRSLGYTVVAPAFVVGKSGTQHTFDMLILGSSRRETDTENFASETKQFTHRRDTVVEIMIFNRPIQAEEITKVYGKVADVECDALIYAIPSLSESARQYAAEFKMQVLEGRNIEEALAAPSFPSLSV